MIEAGISRLSPEFPVGTEVPILEHSGCDGRKGIIIKLDDLGKPKRIKCVNVKCTRKTVYIDRKQMLAEKKFFLS